MKLGENQQTKNIENIDNISQIFTWCSHALTSKDSIYLLVCSLYGRRQWHPTPVLLPGKSHGQRSLGGCSPWGRTESDMTERLPFHFSLSCIGEGNGNPLQCSYLENPRDWGAWWASVYGVAQSWTRLKQLSSSSSLLSIYFTSNTFAKSNLEQVIFFSEELTSSVRRLAMLVQQLYH